MSEETRDEPITRKRNLYYLLAELVIYGVLVVIYLAIISTLLAEPLTHLFHNDLTVYAILALALIVGQGVLLESLTSFLLDQVNLDRPR